MRLLPARLVLGSLMLLGLAAPLTAQAPPQPSPSPMGWAVHSINLDTNWEVDRWLPQARQSGAGWVRDPVYFETYVYPDNPTGTFIPIAGSNPARWMDRGGIADYANEAAKILEGGFHLVLSTWASMDPGDENTAGPVMLELLDQLRLRLGPNASTYMSRLAIEHFSEPNIYAAGRPDIHVEPQRYVEIAAELYTAVKGRAPYRNIPILVGATAHFGLDYSCGFGWQNGPVAVPSDAPPRCARYATAPYDNATEFGLGWLTQILELGIINYTDGFTAHPYRGTSPPEQGFTLIPAGTDSEGFVHEIRMWVNRIEQFNTGHKTLEYQFTEIGYPSAPAAFGAGSEQRQADYLTRLWTVLVHESLLAQGRLDRNEAGGYRMTAFHYNTLKDDCIPSGPFATPPCGTTVPDIEKTGGLLTWDLQPKTGYRYFTQLAAELRVDDLEAVEQAGVSVSAGVPVYTRLFRRKDGTGWILAAWTGTADPVGAGVNISLALDRNYLQVRRTDVTAGGSTTVDVPFGRAGNGIFLNVQLLNRVSFFKIRTAQPTPNDFDGDGKSDIAVWRPSDGTWRWVTSSSGYDASAAQVRQWGHSGDIPISGDFDGDGIADLAIWRPCDGFVPPCGGRWYWLTSSTGYSYNSQQSVQWGAPTDVPVAADYDGDGRTDLAVWRPSTGVWYVLNSSSGYDYRSQWGRQWGAPTDVPVPADYDGDGRTDLAVWRPGTGVWYWLTSSSNYLGARGVEWGAQGDVPIGQDYDNDGYADLVIWRGSETIWYILWSSNGYLYGSGLPQGTSGDRPQVGNFDHDGQLDTALYTPATNLWTIFQTAGTPWTITWGAAGDIPLIRR